MRIPMTVRVLLSISLAACMLPITSGGSNWNQSDIAGLAAASFAELLLGAVFAFAFQAAFAALYFSGRVLDIQAGFGLALLIDPSSRTQTPLIGTLFAYAAGAVFFAADGHLELIRLMSASIEWLPIGAGMPEFDPRRFVDYFSSVLAMGLMLSAAALVTLFLIDFSIAFLSRTLPQMNVLVLGFQVKTIATLLVLATTMGLALPLLIRILASALEFLSGSK